MNRNPILCSKNVSYKINSHVILHDISWVFHQGEHWAILGENGAGKTSLLNIITGYTRPSSGEITVLGERIGHTDLRVLRKRIGWASSSLQEKLYTGETSKEIVESGFYASIGLYDIPNEEERNAAEKILSDLGCMALADRTYKTLSQGEKQKVLIARAIVNNPPLLILDEPCAGLDISAREKIITFIDEIANDNRRPSIIMVTHHVEEIPPSITHVMLIKNGSIFASGEKKEMINDKIISDYFKMRVKINTNDKRYFVSDIK